MRAGYYLNLDTSSFQVTLLNWRLDAIARAAADPDAYNVCLHVRPGYDMRRLCLGSGAGCVVVAMEPGSAPEPCCSRWHAGLTD